MTYINNLKTKCSIENSMSFSYFSIPSMHKIVCLYFSDNIFFYVGSINDRC